MKKFVLVFLLSTLFIHSNSIFGNSMMVLDTCTANDDCQNAIDIPNVLSDMAFTCIAGCNLFASPESFPSSCSIQDFPTVWYKVTTDDLANVMNVFVSSSDFESPTITVFKSETGCDNLQLIGLTSSNLGCVIGSYGEAAALGTSITPSSTYYFAVSSFNSIGGNFEFCLNTISTGSACIVDRNIQVTARSNGGPLEGPFDPKETVSICMNVNEYTAAGNGCQWFQGIVPVFGNGWDPSSFDSLGQPVNATVNGNPFGAPGNGLYGTATWDWFDSVGYHYDNTNLTVSDLDGNGRLDICNNQYEMGCPLTGITGGCCGPCWEDQGDLLPPGWFAYGINGTCGEPGPPIRLDWGDGNTCGGGMGPWQFCFDLVTRDVPDCMLDSTTRDLSIGFLTFADGEVGSWTGSASVCALDRPMKISLQAKCGRVVMSNEEELPALCSGDTLRYQVYHPDVTEWEWNISPFWAVPYITNHGVNGFEIEAPLVNNSDEAVNVSGVFIGSVKGSNDLFIQRINFVLNNTESCFVAVEDPKGKVEKNRIRIFPTPANESAILEWTFDLQNEAAIQVYNSQGILINNIPVSSQEGYQKQIDTQSLETGVYFVSFSNGEFRHVTRLVKM